MRSCGWMRNLTTVSAAGLAAVSICGVVCLIGCKGGDDPTYPISTVRTSNLTCFARTPPPPAGRARLERAFTHLKPRGGQLRRLMHAVQSPANPQQWFAAGQGGTVLSFSAEKTQARVEQQLDIADKLHTESSEGGLMSFALHPKFGDNGHAYLVYTAPRSDGKGGLVSRLARFTRGSDGRFARDSETVVLDIPQRGFAHTGDHVAFGQDGYLYYSVGDDRQADVNAQNASTLSGKLLRLDVDRQDAIRGTPYGIPLDNPFADGRGGAPEVFAYGLRNPWRFTVDPDTQEIFLGDVGRDSYEEVNKIVSGGNYGWPGREGSHCFREELCEQSDFLDPVAEYSHAIGKSIVAGLRYGRDDIEGLRDRLLYADYVTGDIWSAALDSTPADTRQEVEGAFNIVSLTRDGDGVLYALRYERDGDEGGLYRLVRNDPQSSNFPQRLSETGCMSAGDPRQPAAGLVPYTPIAQLWSDDAGKERYLALPDDARVTLRDDGDFEMPVGTVLIKHFRYGDRYHETRLFMRSSEGWAGHSYRWNDEQTDAVLLEAAHDVTLHNGVRWLYPSRSQCLQCHTRAAGDSLGLEVAQLDHAADYGEGTGPAHQLRWLFEHDFFVPEIESAEALLDGISPLADPQGDGAVEDRARAYLHANCAHCHRPGGPGRGDIDLRATTPLREMRVCDESSRVTQLWGFGNYDDQLVLRPGRPLDSILYLRMTTAGLFRMPPLATEVIDEKGSQLVGDWIEELSSCDE